MLKVIKLVAVISFVAASALAQGKSNDVISRQVHALGVEKSITVTFDSAGNSSKIMAVTENFSGSEAAHAGVQAMNFAMGFFYPGSTLAQSPDRVLFTFWVLTKKPRFADNHKLTVNLDAGKTLDLGDARYSPRPRDDMEYLNFEITRTDLAALASASAATFHLGPYNFTLTPQQQKIIRALVRVSDSTITN